MKKILCFIIFFFISVNSFSFAEELKTAPMKSPFAEKKQEKFPTIKPQEKPQAIQEQTPQYKFDTGKPIVANTSKDDSTYEGISLPDAIKYALSHNLDLKGNRINVEQAKNDIKKANALKNPYIQLFLNSGRAATDNPNNFGIMFPIEIAKRALRKKLAKSNYERAQGDLALSQLNLRLDVRQAYVDLVAAKSELKILNQQKILLEELLDIARKKYIAGAVPEMDVIHAKMTLNQLLIQVNTANTNVYVARYNFNKILNSKNLDTKEDYLPEQKDFIDLLTPQPTEKMPEFKDILDIALEKRLDLKNAKKDVDIAQRQLAVIIRQRVPDIDIGGGYIFVPQAMATDDKYSQGAYIAANLNNIPLLYRYTPEIKNAKLEVDQRNLAFESLKNKDIMDLHSAYDSFKTAQDNLNYYNDILLSETKQFLYMAKRSYQVGKSSMTDFIFVQQNYREILLGYTEALANYYDAWVEILRQVNDEELKLNG